MNSNLYALTPEALARIRAIADRVLPRDEFEAYVSQPMSDEERDEILALHRWFTRRYPTPSERLAYAHRAFGRARALREAVVKASQV